MQPQPSLNLLPTVQQAISNLLTVYEPEFLRFGYRPLPCLRRDRDRLAGRADDVLGRTPG